MSRIESFLLIRPTSGLGLYEYMTFCEDVGMEAIMAVWSGGYLPSILVTMDVLIAIYPAQATH